MFSITIDNVLHSSKMQLAFPMERISLFEDMKLCIVIKVYKSSTLLLFKSKWICTV